MGAKEPLGIRISVLAELQLVLRATRASKVGGLKGLEIMLLHPFLEDNLRLRNLAFTALDEGFQPRHATFSPLVHVSLGKKPRPRENIDGADVGVIN
jgi:hypothetical protein